MYHVILSARPKRLLNPAFRNVLKSNDKDDIPDAVVFHDEEPEIIGKASSLLTEHGIPHYLMFRDNEAFSSLKEKIQACSDKMVGVVLYGTQTKESVAAAGDIIEAEFPGFFNDKHLLVAAENAESLAALPEFVDDARAKGFFIGSSYMSENIELYKRLDHSTFNSLLRGATKLIHKKSKYSFGTGGFCSYDGCAQPRGDRNMEFMIKCGTLVNVNKLDGGIIQYLNQVNITHKLLRGENLDLSALNMLSFGQSTVEDKP